VLNDHLDATYDATVVARLSALHDRVSPVLEDLAAALPRFAPYRVRLEHAVRQVRAGQGEWFTKPTLDSFHTVWFELHEDLLGLMGLTRSQENAASRSNERRAS
jgi:pyruvate,orthophosphate dikinase